MTRYRSDDISLLLPAMAAKTQEVLDAMTALGFQPVLFDGLRTAEEALRNSKRGTGSLKSMHLYGCAADVICDQHGWDCRKKRCKFYTKLGQVTKSLGFVWGGDWEMGDMPHFQAVRLQDQNAMRALGVGESSAAERNQMVLDFFARAS